MSTRRASTVLVVRDGPDGMEVLMLRRVDRADDLHSGAHVFPGGTLDPGDSEVGDWCAGLDDAQASERLRVPRDGLAHYVAAARELFEEAGVLLACDASPRPADLRMHPPALVARLRSQLRAGRIGLRDVCECLGVKLALDTFAYHSHWVTPLGLAKRFDTRFFVAAMPPHQNVATDSAETIGHTWVRPGAALAAGDAMRLPFPTRRTLAAVSAHAWSAHCLASTRALADIPCIVPRMAQDADGARPVHPADAAYAEIGRLDPHGEGHASCALEPGRAVRLAPGVLRVTAPNAGLMTGPGTNTYLVGNPAGDRWVVIDPGPADAGHVQAVLAAAPGRIHAVLVTHSHADHSPASTWLKARTGAEVLGMRARHAQGQDASFSPDRLLAHGDRVPLGGDVELEVIHTPGHASNHLCYLLRSERMLFTGDHVMQGSTVVIAPPDGDMGEYMASLTLLQREDLAWLAPGHGFLIGDPGRALAALVSHRRAREAKVVRALSRRGPTKLMDLLKDVYDDVPPSLHAAAMRSLSAHLLHLQARRKVSAENASWSLTSEGHDAPG